MEEAKILELYRQRDQRAVEETEKAYGALCRGLAGKILRDPRDVEECVNDGYLRLWQRIPPERPESLKSYLACVVRNLALDRLRRADAVKRGGSSVTVCLDELEQITGRDEVERRIMTRELGRAVDRFLRTQKPEQRMIFLRRYYYLESRREIARRFGISAAQVSVTLSRVRKRLRTYLKQERFL